jgi:hypothetical protein
MQEVIGDRYEPGKPQKLGLDACHAGLYCRRRLDQPAFDGKPLVLREVLEEPLERLLPFEEEVPGLVVVVKKRAYAPEIYRLGRDLRL